MPWLTIIKWVGIAIVCFMAYRYVENWCNGACHAAQEERDALQAKLDARDKRNAEIIVGLSDSLMKEKDHAATIASDRDRLFLAIENSVTAVHHASVALPADVVRVSIDANRAANGETGPDPQAGAAGAAPPSAIPAATLYYDAVDLANYNVQTDKAYKTTVDLLRSCYRQEMAYWTAINSGANP